MTTNNKTSKGVLVDLTRCIGCRGCQIACKSWNERSTKPTVMSGVFTNPPKLNSETYTHINYIEQPQDSGQAWHFVKDQCMHCKDPACVSACPVNALEKTSTGPVIYHYSRCIGCRYCMIACPFQIPKYEWEKALTPWVQKCTFCSERIANELVPACIKVCPTQVMHYGTLEEVLREAKKRQQDSPGRYVDRIYGEKEAGGTAWVYLSSVPFEQLGFNVNIPDVQLPSLTWASLNKIPATVGGFVAALSLIAWFRNRGSKGEQSAQGKEK